MSCARYCQGVASHDRINNILQTIKHSLSSSIGRVLGSEKHPWIWDHVVEKLFVPYFVTRKYLSLLILLLWMLSASSKKKETQNKVEKLVTGTGTFECVLDLYEGL